MAPKTSKMDEPQRKTEREPDRGDTQKPEPQKAETVKAEGQQGQKTEATGREKAIKKFMDSFESEFGIPSARLVEAIANLNPEEQVKAPEETADAVVDQLGLDDKDAERASALYASLLVDLSKTQPQAPKQAPLMMAGGSFSEGIQQRSAMALEKKNLMNAGVDKLNQSFWAKPTAAEGGMGAMNANMHPSSQALSRMMLDGQMEQPDATGAMGENALAVPERGLQGGEGMELPPHLKGQLQSDASANLSPAVLAALMAKQAQAKAAAAQEAGEENSEASDESAVAGTANGKSNFEAPSMKSESSIGLGLGGAAAGLAKSSSEESASSFSKQPGGQGQDDFAKAMAHQKANVKDAAKLSDKADFKASMDKPLTGMEGLNASTLPKPDALQVAAAGGAVVGANMQAPTTAEHDANIRQLMNQAQYLVKKGGGEVKVQMTPEGMGPVHLKLMVQDGKVNVHMQAESAEAKKTIESGLAELKTSLAAHKLSVDHIKVDVVNSTSTDVATNNQPNLNSGAQRDNTQKFWNQFNENFGSQQQRDSFTDMGDVRGYGTKRDPLTALDSSKARSRSVEGRGRSVNVVA